MNTLELEWNKLKKAYIIGMARGGIICIGY